MSREKELNVVKGTERSLVTILEMAQGLNNVALLGIMVCIEFSFGFGLELMVLPMCTDMENVIGTLSSEAR